jgi:hypothetical protein
MFGTHRTFKQLSGGIAIAAALAVIAVPTAAASTFITDTLGGNGSPKAQPDVFERYVATHNAPKTDVLERSVAIQQARQALTQARAISSAPVHPSGNGFNWTVAGVGMGLVALLLALLVVLGGQKRRQQRRVLAV